MNLRLTKLSVAISTLLLSLFVAGIRQPQSQQTPAYEPPTDPVNNLVVNVPAENKSTYEKVIYVCRAEGEEAPAVEIAEVKDASENHLGVIAHVYQPNKVNFMVEGATAEWSYSTVSAQSKDKSIKIAHHAEKDKQANNWLLTLAGEGISLKQNLKNCSEISDE